MGPRRRRGWKSSRERPWSSERRRGRRGGKNKQRSSSRRYLVRSSGQDSQTMPTNRENRTQNTARSMISTESWAYFVVCQTERNALASIAPVDETHAASLAASEE